MIEARIAHELLSGHAGQEVAFLCLEDQVWFARRAPRARFEPDSAIVRLIQGVYERSPEHWRTLLRRRIFATGHASVMCRGMVRVAAKRLTDEVVPVAGELPALTWTEVPPVAAPPAPAAVAFPAPETAEPATEPKTDPINRAAIREALALAATIPREGPRHQLSRPIAAILTAADGQVLARAIHSGARNRALHAEVCLVQDHWRRTGRGLPAGARIYATLQPCKMCAAMILDCAEAPASLRVFYAEPDPGPLARNTALERAGLLERLSPGPRALASAGRDD